MIIDDLDTYLAELRETGEPAMPQGMPERIWARVAAHQDRMSARRSMAMGSALVAGALMVGMLTPNGAALARADTDLLTADLSLAPSVLLEEGL